MFPQCHKCGIEMESNVVVVSENNPEPFPQGSMRKYNCPKCGITFVEQGLTESKRPETE